MIAGDEELHAEVGRLLGRETAGALRFLAEGMDFRVYTAGALLLRFPKRDECARWLVTERALLEALAPVLPARIPRPRPDLAAAPGFAAYDFIPGVTADRLAPSGALASALGGFLGALHAFPREVAEALGVPHLPDKWRPPAYLDFVRGQASAAPAWPDGLDAALARGCAAFLDADPPPLPEAPLPGCVIHGDLEAEHLLCDERTGELTGVIDWADVSIADPARDLAALWAWGGTGFLERLLAAYPLPLDPGLRARVPYLGRCFALSDWIEAADEDGERRAFARRQLEQAFEEVHPG